MESSHVSSHKEGDESSEITHDNKATTLVMSSQKHLSPDKASIRTSMRTKRDSHYETHQDRADIANLNLSIHINQNKMKLPLNLSGKKSKNQAMHLQVTDLGHGQEPFD
jgi:hypothetical protein